MCGDLCGECGAGPAEAVEDGGLEFVEALCEHLDVLAGEEGDVEYGVSDDFDEGGEEVFDVAFGAADKDGGHGFFAEAGEEVLQCRRVRAHGVFGDEQDGADVFLFSGLFYRILLRIIHNIAFEEHDARYRRPFCNTGYIIAGLERMQRKARAAGVWGRKSALGSH